MLVAAGIGAIFTFGRAVAHALAGSWHGALESIVAFFAIIISYSLYYVASWAYGAPRALHSASTL